MKQLLTEMPWATNVKCPDCGFKFGFDGQIERWTPDKKTNKDFLVKFFRIRQMAIECPNCNRQIVKDFASSKTYRYDEIIQKVKPSVKKFFMQSLSLTKPLLQNDMAVIPERLTFETFVDGQTDHV
jgi:DNA-directed RNA polymerase subunit RPC12/RpoP